MSAACGSAASSTSAISRPAATAPIFDRLDKDLQEAWAIHGLYPQYAWTPDGTAIVIWGQGKIWRVDVAAGRGDAVPFTAHVEQTVNEAVRFEQTVHTPEFQVKALRSVVVSPDGKRVAYSALGHLYVKDLPGGQPKRVTNADAFEYLAQVVGDGQWIVYTTWTDADYGRVRVVRPDGTAGRDVVPTPGHYTEPAFSPDGKWIVYRSTGRRRHARTALRRRTRASTSCRSTARRRRGSCAKEGSIRRSTRPASACSSTTSARAKAVLVSVGIGDPGSPLSGGDDVVHFQSDNATQIAPSPDGKWVAFAERWHAFVAPFARTGRPVDLSPTMEGYPTARISQDAGFNLHWSGDSRRVHWSLGPDLYTRDVARTFTFLDATSADAGSAGSEGHEHRLHRADRRARRRHRAGRRAGSSRRRATADRERHRRRRGQSDHGGRPAGVAIPAGAQADRRPRQDDHAGHHRRARARRRRRERDPRRRRSWPLHANLAFGVTTIHDPSNDTEMVFTDAEMVRAGMKLGPRIFSTGTILYGAETPFKAIDQQRTTTRCRTLRRHEGGRRVQREELQPAAPRRAPDDRQGRARAADDGGARRRARSST